MLISLRRVLESLFSVFPSASAKVHGSDQQQYCAIEFQNVPSPLQPLETVRDDSFESTIAKVESVDSYEESGLYALEDEYADEFNFSDPDFPV